MRFLALGDSYTTGEGVPRGESWPVQLVDALRSNGYLVDDPRIVAETGWTAGELLEGIESAGLEGTFDLVSLQIGVNDQYRGNDEKLFPKELRSCLSRAVAFAGGEPSRVMVVSIPDWGVTPFASGRDRDLIASQIDRFNGMAEKESLAAGAGWVDITPISRDLGTGERMLAADLLHPSGMMYSAWIPVIATAAAIIIDMHK